MTVPTLSALKHMDSRGMNRKIQGSLCDELSLTLSLTWNAWSCSHLLGVDAWLVLTPPPVTSFACLLDSTIARDWCQKLSFSYTSVESNLRDSGDSAETQQGFCLEKLLCLNPEKIVGSFIVTVQRECDQLVVGGEVGRSLHYHPSGPSGLGSTGLWAAIPSLIFAFSHLEGVPESAKQLKDIVGRILWWESKTLPWGCSWLLPPFPPVPS